MAWIHYFLLLAPLQLFLLRPSTTAESKPATVARWTAAGAATALIATHPIALLLAPAPIDALFMGTTAAAGALLLLITGCAQCFRRTPG